MRCGFVSLVGRPNVGKSTLLNSLLGMKLAITSNVSGTTRNVIQGIYNDDDSQIIFVDTPGVHKPINKLGNLVDRMSINIELPSNQSLKLLAPELPFKSFKIPYIQQLFKEIILEGEHIDKNYEEKIKSEKKRKEKLRIKEKERELKELKTIYSNNEK